MSKIRNPDWFSFLWWVRWGVLLSLALWQLLHEGPLRWVLWAFLAVGVVGNLLLDPRNARNQQVDRARLGMGLDLAVLLPFLTLDPAAATGLPVVVLLPVSLAMTLFGWRHGLTVFMVFFACGLLGMGELWFSDPQAALVGAWPFLPVGIVTMVIGYLTCQRSEGFQLGNSLRETLASFHESVDSQAALSRLLSGGAELVNADRLAVYSLVDGGAQLVLCCSGHAPKGDTIGEDYYKYFEVEVAEEALHKNQAVTWSRTEDPALNPNLPMYGPARLLCAAAIPLRSEDTSIGVLVAFRAVNPSSFEAHRVTVLEMLALHVSVILAYRQVSGILRHDRTALEAIVNSIPSGVLVTDERGRIVLLNPAAENQLRVREADAMGRRLSEMETDLQVIEILEDSQRTGEARTEEITLSHMTNLITRIECRQLQDDQHMRLGQVAIFNDITELRRLDHLKSEFVSAVSHELRTPLTSIKAFTATLLRAEFDRETQLEFLTVVNAQCDRLTRLINDLLSISKIETGSPLELNWARVNLGKVLERVIRVHQGYTRLHTFNLQVDPDAQFLDGDEDKLERIMTNLVNNAVKYSPEGGEIVIHALPEGDHVVLTVADQGIGIPQDQQHAVFEKFYQVDGSRTRRAGGSGLGLFLVKHLVEAHGGSIWVESAPGKGSTFSCRFPRSHTTVLGVSGGAGVRRNVTAQKG